MNYLTLFVVLFSSTFPGHECFVVPGNGLANRDLGLLGELDLTEDVEDDDMPEQVTAKFVMGERYVDLDLRKSQNIPSNAPVFVAERGHIAHWKSSKDTTFATYSDHDKRASIVVEKKKENGKTVRNFRGTVAVDGEYYLLEPYHGNRQRSSLDDERLVDIDGVDHVMKRERVDLEFEEEFHSPDSRLRAKLLKILEREEEGDEDNDDDEFPVARGGFQKYEVEMLVVLDYALYNRWFKSSKASGDKAKEDDAVQNLQYYFSHVVNGVDMRYKNIKETDFSISVSLVGYYIAKTAVDSPWTERGGIKMMYKDHAYTDIYKGIDVFQQWTTDAPAMLGIAFDQATLFSGNFLYDGKFRPDGSPTKKEGLAPNDGICWLKKPKAASVSINRDVGVYSSIQTAAHELGHNLGAEHDGEGNGCTGNDQFVMASYPRTLTDANFGNPFKFSKCSIDYFRKLLTALNAKKSGNCLLTNTAKPVGGPPPNFKPLPGIQYDVKLQCQITFGPESYYCAEPEHDQKICQNLYCFSPIKSACSSGAEVRAYDGTPCGSNKWCMSGKCVAKTMTREETVDDDDDDDEEEEEDRNQRLRRKQQRHSELSLW